MFFLEILDIPVPFKIKNGKMMTGTVATELFKNKNDSGSGYGVATYTKKYLPYYVTHAAVGADAGSRDGISQKPGPP
jgi:hypothetical protein